MPGKGHPCCIRLSAYVHDKHNLAHNLHVGLQAAYLNRLQLVKGSAKQALKVTDQLLAARPALLPEYISIAKSTGKLSPVIAPSGLWCF